VSQLILPNQPVLQGKTAAARQVRQPPAPQTS
jgi:hypothetical protein